MLRCAAGAVSDAGPNGEDADDDDVAADPPEGRESPNEPVVSRGRSSRKPSSKLKSPAGRRGAAGRSSPGRRAR
jgi:hypothetical protein